MYVVLIAELAHALSAHIDLAGLVGYAFLFVILWWAWLNGTLYHDLHGNNDIHTRVYTFLQISQPHALAFLFTTLLFVVSVFAPPPWRFYRWGLALVLSLSLPVVTLNLGRREPQVQAQIDLSTDVSPSAVGRFGLFAIVLSEVIVAVVRGVARHHHLSLAVGATASLRMLIAIGCSGSTLTLSPITCPRPGNVTVSGWMCLHLPMTMGIAAVGTAIVNVVEQAGEPCLLRFAGCW